jgi:hypothetical protein
MLAGTQPVVAYRLELQENASQTVSRNAGLARTFAQIS